MILVQVSNSNAVRLFEPENFVPNRYVKKINKLLLNADIDPTETEDEYSEDLSGFATILMVEVINEHLESHGHQDGPKKKDAHLKDAEVNEFVKSVYSEAGAAMKGFETNKKKLVKIKRTIADAGGNNHEITIRLLLINAINDF